MRVVCGDNDHTKVKGKVFDVDVKEKLFSDARDANRGPSFSVLHGGVGEDVVENHSYVS